MIEVTPKVYLLGATHVFYDSLEEYLKDTDNLDFLNDIREAQEKHNLTDVDILTSFFAKLCYLALSVGLNANITRTRSIRSNITNTMESGHGSVFEHCQFNFVLSDVSRVLTHELVRHRIGVAFSQESGRYCRIPKEGSGMFIPTCIRENPEALTIYKEAVDVNTPYIQKLYKIFGIDAENFTEKKILTSAIRRIAPTGSANEIGISLNTRSLRHIIGMRTSRHAEEEIRIVFSEMAKIIEEKYPLMLHGGISEEVNGIDEWTFPKLHGYERDNEN
ncbi:MAG: FAD-dependent thymidylate synthase [Patescibacteria group bacterium]|nr:FAD-dependent thymidylate synthase [Patescibacteria group bacterium]